MVMLNSIGGSGVEYASGPGIIVDNETALISIEPVSKSQIDGAVQENTRNQANGFAGLDGGAFINALVKVRVVDRVTADSIVPGAGELVVVEQTGVHELRFGNALMAGGYGSGIGSPNTIVVPARGTATENGQALFDAYSFAKTFNPYGNAKSATNKCYLQMLGGIYDNTGSQILLDTPFIEFIGMGRSTRWYPNAMQLNEGATDYAFRNLTFYKPGASYSISTRVNNDATYNVTWDNVVMEGAVDDVWNTIISRTGGTTNIFNITAKNVKTACKQIWVGASNLSGTTVNLDIDRCDFTGSRIFAAIATANRHLVGGSIRNSRFALTANMHFDQQANFRMYNCDYNQPCNYCVTGARFEHVTFRTGAIASLGGVSAGQSVAVAHCTMAVANHATLPITNSIGTDTVAMNVRSDV